MAEIKQGLNYEITANDKASAVVNKAAETAKKAAKDTEDSSKKAGEAFKGEFNPMSAVLAGISGNTEALAQQMLGLVSRLKSVHMTMMKFSLYAAFVMAVVAGVKLLVEKFEESRVKADQIRLDKAQTALKTLNDDQARFNAQLDEARARTNDVTQNILNELAATDKLTTARREYNKALELSLAKTEEERAAIERRYSADSAAAKAESEKTRIAAERARIIKDISTWEEQIADYTETAKGQRWAARMAAKSQRHANDRIRGSVFGVGIEADEEIAKTSADAFTAAVSGMQASLKAVSDLEAKIKNAKSALGNLKTAEAALSYEQATVQVNNQRAAAEAAKAAEIKAAAEKEEAAKLQAEKDREIQRIAEAEAKTVKAAQLKAHRDVMATRRKDLERLTALESQAAARVAAAQSKVAEAWGWYRDKDKMAAQLKEEKAEAEAQRQFEKDFEDLKWRRDWRTAKDLSVDQEAVRRVAIAKEEETAAQKALAETAKSTAQAAASLAEIEKVITQEG